MSDGTDTVWSAGGWWRARCSECPWESGRLYQKRDKAKAVAEAHRDKHHNYAPPSEDSTRG